jgi:hypothetical protein
VLLIDELAALTGYVGDRETKRRIANARGLLLSQGRAVGVVVVAAVQDPRKDTIPARELFPCRIALQLNGRRGNCGTRSSLFSQTPAFLSRKSRSRWATEARR